MDFFGAEGRAKKRTTRLLILFGFAVAGTVVAGYFGSLFALRVAHGYAAGRQAYAQYGATPPGGDDAADGALWQPGLFVGVAFGTLAVIGLASLYKWTEF
ncbi:MAG TPA: hypothetical protein VII09_05460, partial [Opitutaceae bacterium]